MGAAHRGGSIRDQRGRYALKSVFSVWSIKSVISISCRRPVVAALVFIGAAPSAFAQQAAPAKFDRTGVGDTSIFAPLMLGTPTLMRAASGAPGSKYWQN